MSVIRTKIPCFSGFIKEHWTSESEAEIRGLYQSIEKNYPRQGYGTTIYDIKPDATGLLWHATFSRSQSCD